MDEMNNHFGKLRTNISHYLSLNQYDKASILLKEALASYPENALFNYQMASVYFHKGQFKEAQDQLSLAANYGFHEETVSILHAHIQFGNEQWHEAEQFFLKALELNPINANTLANYGMLLVRTGYREKGMTVLQKAEHLDPYDEAVLRFRMYYEVASDPRRMSMIHMRHYIEAGNDEENISMEMGLTDYYKGHFRSARDHFRNAFLKNPRDPIMLHNLRLAEYEANILFYPIQLTNKIGGMAFLVIIVAAVIFALIPFYPVVFWKFIIALLLLGIYLIIAHVLVLIHLRAKHSVYSYWTYLLNPVRLLKGFGLMLLIICPLAAGPIGFWLSAYFIRKTVERLVEPVI